MNTRAISRQGRSLPGIFEGIAVAIAASVVAAVLFAAMTTVFHSSWVLRVVVAVLAAGYVLYLLGRSQERVGRVTTVATWTLASVAIWMAPLPLPQYLLAHIGLLWLVRSLYFHSGVLQALLDLGLNGLAFSSAVWAALQSNSVFLSVWCFFLVQALFVFIPGFQRASGQQAAQAASSAGESRFDRAHREAQSALRRMSSIH